MRAGNSVKIAIAVVLLAGAGVILYRFFNKPSDIPEQDYFYDLSAKKLFASSRESLPPIKGIDSPEEDGVRAVVICASGDSRNPANRSIAYLEKYTPELKQNLQQVRIGKAEPMPSKLRNSYRLVKRTDDAEWHPVGTPEGEKILNGWNVAGPDGQYPEVCTP